mmetsp:Transcript_27617/g.57114  ORF Transcript_27617/g.57114 Transcript_27617/m.57114 type:complete len:496 (-) Transcript_27617:155-1642(-)
MSYNLPPEGSRVRLIGLKNPSLNGQVGQITGYAQGGERVMISLLDTPSPSVVKVKPKQMEVFTDGPRRRMASRSRSNGYGNSMRRGLSRDLRDDASHELVQLLKSADEMFEMADTSGDGVISKQEFDYYMKRNTKHSKEMIHDAFRMIDRDGDGEITMEEVRKAFLQKRREVNGKSGLGGGEEDELLMCSRDADALFERADTSGDGYLSKMEFELYMKRNTKHSDIAIRELFSMMDVDNDGFITRDEVRRVFLRQKKESGGNGAGIEGGEKMSMGELLGLDDDDMNELADDVYNMFFLSRPCGQAFWYALLIFALKTGLFVIIAIDLLTNKSFPDGSEVPLLVKCTQFLLLPVAVAIEEELIVTFFIYSNLKWSPVILELNPYAYKYKYHLGNMMRLIDGLLFLFINTSLLLQAVDILSMFLNFAALQFLQEIDNIALHLARDGYLTENLEEVANDVTLMKLPRNHNGMLQVLDSLLLFVTFVVLVVAWVLVQVL